MVNKIKHPKLKVKNNLIMESINNRLNELLGLKTTLEQTSDNSIRLSFNKKLGESANTQDFIKDELKQLLYMEYGLVPVVSRHKDAYNIILNPDNVYLENHKEHIESNVDPNIILDSRFIWLFSLLDKSQNILVEDIDSLDDAIELAIDNHEIKIIIANPFIDPDPKNKDVDLVFADNPGPVIIYDGTRAQDFQEDGEEEVLEETTQVDAINYKVSYKLNDNEEKAISNKIFKDWWLARDKDNDLFLFKSKPIRSTINLEHTGDAIRWLPEFGQSLDYRDFNKHKESFKFVTWENSPIKVSVLLGKEQKDEIVESSVSEEELNIFKVIETLVNAFQTDTDKFIKLMSKLVKYEDEVLKNILINLKAILNEFDSRESTDSLERLKIALNSIKLNINNFLENRNKKETNDLRELAKSAGVI